MCLSRDKILKIQRMSLFAVVRHFEYREDPGDEFALWSISSSK